MKELTLRQQEILGYLQLHAREQGYWPSIRDIQQHFGFKSTNAVMGHLRALERKGCISRVPGQARAFRVTFDPTEKVPEEASEVVDIPIYGSIAAGFPEGVEPGGEIGRLQIDVETVGMRRSRRAFALKVRGESMIDAGIFEGDVVILEHGLPENGDIVAALIDGETTLKRFIQRAGKPPYLQAENDAYPDLHPVADLTIQGVAKAVVRSL
ncbi:MAG: transcriptional repressor LexA [Opitutales bacterium]